MAEQAEKGAGAQGPVSEQPTPGDRLRAGREERELSVEQAARELRLDQWMVEALEANDYDAFGAPVFAKGHLRKYAGLVGIDPDDIMISYYRLRDIQEAPPLSGGVSLRSRDGVAAARWIGLAGVGLLIGVVLAAGWWFFVRTPSAPPSVGTAAFPAQSRSADRQLTTVDPEPAPAEAAAPPGEPAAVDTGLTLDNSVGSLSSGDESDEAQESAGSADAEPEPPAAPVEEAGAGAEAPVPRMVVGASPGAADPVNLTLRFREESWVEITDATGARLLYGTGSAGRSQSLRGQPPLEVFLGRFLGVDIEVDGNPYSIGAEAIRGNTARFSIGREGSG